MSASLTQPRHVSDEGLRVVKLCGEEEKARKEIDGTSLATPANHVPAAAVATWGANVARNYWA